MIDRFVSFTTWSTFAIQLRPIYFYFIVMVSFRAAIWRDSVSFLRFLFLRHVQVLSSKISLVYRLKYPCNFFLLFCFLVIDVLLVLVFLLLFLVALISLSLLFFHVVFESSGRWANPIFNAGDSSFSFSWHIDSVYIIYFTPSEFFTPFFFHWSHYPSVWSCGRD